MPKGIAHHNTQFGGKKKKNKSTKRQKSTHKEREAKRGTHKNKYKEGEKFGVGIMSNDIGPLP